MNFKNEKQLLFVIRYALAIFILFLSIVITTFLYFENRSSFKKIKKITQEKFVEDKKQLIKQQVNNIYDYIVHEQTLTENNLRKSLQNRVREAHKIITNIYKEYGNKLSKEELIKLIKTVIKDIRFNNNRGYFFVYDNNAVNIIHALFPHLEGQDLSSYKDAKGKYLAKESLDLLKDKSESFQELYWRKSKDDLKQYKKIGFVKNIYELNWFMGTGEYVDDFTSDIQKKVISQVEKLKFGKHSYVFILDKNDIYLTHIDKEKIGKKISELDALTNTKQVINSIKLKAYNGGGFVNYTQKINPFTKDEAKKISYIRTIPQWNWIIGTGFYVDDVQSLIDEQEKILSTRYNENIKDILIVSVFVTLVLLAISFYISSIIASKFGRYKNSIQHHMDENKKQYELLAQKSKLAAMGEMMENIAHQWRQPLSLITTSSSGIKLQKELGILDDKFLLESVDSISNCANHLSQTIEDFRDFFKPDKEKLDFTILHCIDKTFKLLSSQVKKANIQVVENIQDIQLKGYERELLQVLLNVINNAKDALSDKKDDKYIFIDIYKEDNKAIIKIKDNAGGIKDEIIHRIFEPYFTTKHKSQGTGLGLYMSQEIINRHMNGSLEVCNENFTYENKEYKGALFTLSLPLSL